MLFSPKCPCVFSISTAGDSSGVVRGPHVSRTRFANPEPLFRHVDLVLCHGGNGTIYQALSYGLPLLCKTAHFEQEWNVQALEKANLGTSLDKIKSTADYIQIIDDGMRKKGCAELQAMQQKLRAHADFSPVVSRIFKLLPANAQCFYLDLEKKSA